MKVSINQLLWTTVAETGTGFLIGFYSHFDKDKNVNFTSLPKNRDFFFACVNRSLMQYCNVF